MVWACPESIYRECIDKRMLNLELTGKRARGRPKLQFMFVVKENMKVVGARGEEAEEKVRRRQMI
jgi:hypothetical protein